MKHLLFISIIFFSRAIQAQELTPAQIAAITKADSLAVVALNLALRNAIYSLNSALAKSNAITTAKDRAQDSIISLMRVSEKSLKDTNVVQSKMITALTAKNAAQDKVIADLQKQITAIKTVANKAASDALQYSTLIPQTGGLTIKQSTSKKNTFTIAIDTAISNLIKSIPKIISANAAQDTKIRALELVRASKTVTIKVE